MHGMINRALQCFLRDTYGVQTWAEIADAADLGFENFEAMLGYPDSVTLDVLSATARYFRKPVESILEDLGTYLVSHPNVEPIRRLLRFGGGDFTEFLFSLNELQGRARMALPDLEMPELTVELDGEAVYLMTCSHDVPGFGYVMVGVLRAMADDYGALVFLEHQGWKDAGEEVIHVHLLEAAFAQGRSFDLVAPEGFVT
ncbi:heme NO-binding domain-containing protein [Celeribacter sp.]|uniref:heme NO-binding domain-containing protein n=1 Tax=Celeribacter sp. TaxID=1890673 RepID=UPI003A914933